MSKIEIMRALADCFEKVPNVGICELGAPFNPGPGDSYIPLDWDTNNELNESGGVSDEATVIVIVSVIGEIGPADVPLKLATEIEARINAFKGLLEKDVTLGNLVSQTQIKKSTAQVVPSADNSWEAGCRIELEVKEW